MNFIENNFWILYGVATAISLIGGIYISIKENDRSAIEFASMAGVIPGINVISAAIFLIIACVFIVGIFVFVSKNIELKTKETIEDKYKKLVKEAY